MTSRFDDARISFSWCNNGPQERKCPWAREEDTRVRGASDVPDRPAEYLHGHHTSPAAATAGRLLVLFLFLLLLLLGAAAAARRLL